MKEGLEHQLRNSEKSDYRKCLKCQEPGRLVNAQEQSVQKFCDAAEIHKDIIYERLKYDMENLRSGKKNVVWHKECYKQYKDH